MGTPIPSLRGLDGRFVHTVAANNTIPDGSFAGNDDVIWLPQEYVGSNPQAVDRFSNISVPLTIVNGVNSRVMEWSSTTEVIPTKPGAWVAKSVAHPFWGLVTTVHDLVRQINQRYLGNPALTPQVILRCEMIDRAAASRLVFTPGSTPVDSSQNFPLFVDPDGDGAWEPASILVITNSTFAPNILVDAGRILARLNNNGLSEPAAPW